VETFSRDYVEQLRAEAAKYRNEKKDAVEAAKAAVAQEWETKLAAEQTKVGELTTKLGDAEMALAKLTTAIDLKVPTEKILAFAEIIKGSNEDEIKASANTAMTLFGGFNVPDPATDPTQGSGSRTIPLNGDPILAAISAAVGA